MTTSALLNALADPNFQGEDLFGLLRATAELCNIIAEAEAAQEAIIRVLDRRTEFPDELQQVIDALTISAGLFPYVNASTLGASDAFRLELNRPLHLESEIVFHAEQNLVYRWLLDGRSVILSAPTSFGKSLVIDGVLASGLYQNIVVVVPTIALIDETRRRLQRFNDQYKIISHSSQTVGERNVFVLTQERVIDFDLPPIDFFVIDEFYKLGMNHDPQRASMLNLALYKLRRTAKAFYFLGPNVLDVVESVKGKLEAHFLRTQFKTVLSEVIMVPQEMRNLNGLVDLCLSQSEPTLIFAKSAPQVREIAGALSRALAPLDDPLVQATKEWVAQEFHPEWSYGTSIGVGVGLHHGRIPRSLQQLSVRLFNAGVIRFLVCTSTLIEGVNTSAKSVMIYDNKIATTRFDFFTFNNIKGRAGRMRQHFIGRVFLFHDPPIGPLPVVDVPIISQPGNLPLTMAVEMESADLSAEVAARLDEVLDPEVLPNDIVRKNVGVEPLEQVSFARKLRGLSSDALSVLSWSGIPDSPQLKMFAEMAWDSFPTFRPPRDARVFTVGQLRRHLRILGSVSLKSWIDEEASKPDADPDDVVEGILLFMRNYCGFQFPRVARAAERIINNELGRRGLPTANYGYYIGRVESLFLHPMVQALDEFGIPQQIASKVNAVRELPEDLDMAIEEVFAAAENGVLSDFESIVVRGALGSPEDFNR